MDPNDVGERLHDRATRGVELTAEEQAQLNEWYAQRDRLEADANAANVNATSR